jgi:hypothetical protein
MLIVVLLSEVGGEVRGPREGPATEKRRNIMREDWMRYGFLPFFQ